MKMALGECIQIGGKQQQLAGEKINVTCCELPIRLIDYFFD